MRNRAKDVLLTMEIAQEGSETAATVSQDLHDIEGLDSGTVAQLQAGGIRTRDDLADLAIDELIDITGQSQDDARALILKARAHWFADDAAAHE